VSAPRKALLTSAAVGVTALGAAIGVASVASADPTATPSPSASESPATTSTPSGTPSSTTPDSGGQRGPDQSGLGRGFRRDQLAQELASKLGVSQDQVASALNEVWEENRPFGEPNPGQPPDPAERDAALAKALAPKLGIDEAKVKSALDEIRAERQAERAAALTERLDAAVQAGTLTRAEADAVQKAVEKGVIHAGP
jgi:hypothetical protein